MKPTRRELTVLLSALGAAPVKGAGARLPSLRLDHEQLAVKTNGENKSRAILDGTTHLDFPVEVHETELGPGMMPHAAHSHVHEEVVLIREGTLEVTIAGQSSKLGPGSVAYVASNEHHGWKNVGSDRAKYFVIAFGPKK